MSKSVIVHFEMYQSQWPVFLAAVLLADWRARAESVRGAEAEDQPGQSCLLQQGHLPP